jgi:hypothetical protein
MTPNTLLEALKPLPADAPLVFRADGAAIGAGYHVTELKSSSIESVDCAGRVSSWHEASLQLLDGRGGDHMAVGKFRAILAQSIDRVPGIARRPLSVEFSFKNMGLQIYGPGLPVVEGDRVVIELSGHHAQCKPASAARKSGTSATTCCG